jgi:hypothetical protein
VFVVFARLHRNYDQNVMRDEEVEVTARDRSLEIVFRKVTVAQLNQPNSTSSRNSTNSTHIP